MLRVVLVDDERLARQGIRHLLAAHPEVTVVGEAGRVATAAEIIREEKPDAIFLDIQMPGASGFDLLGRLEDAPKVVFVTAHTEHAAHAFEVQAVDYLLKPVRPERMADAVKRLAGVCAKAEESVPYQPVDRICLRTPQRTMITRLSEVVAMEAEGDFTRFHVAGEAPLLVCRSLRTCEEEFPQPPFARLSRSLIVNLTKVTSVEHPSRDEARLTLAGTTRIFELGRRALARFKRFSP
ncbi:MAG: LytR/AlgR family response regulator transcription factor [Terrimicrobiaceae bacterium]